MQEPVDQAISDAAAAEATWTSAGENVSTIQTAISAAQSPLPDAQNKLATATTAYGAFREREALAQAATDEYATLGLPVPPSVAPPASS